MGLSDFVEKLQNKPKRTRVLILWAGTAIFMTILFVLWAWNFNLGIQEQVKLGDKLGVDRNGKIVGTVQVEKLYDHFAAATILEEPKDAPIKEGDNIRKV